MTTLVPVSGMQIYIGGTMTAKTTYTEDEFSGESWTEIKGWETKGEIGDAANIISTTLINEGRVVKTKGTFDAGSSVHRFAEILGDAGQTALKTAAAAKGASANYAFKVEYDDLPSGGANPTTELFTAIVSGYRKVSVGGNAVVMIEGTLERTSNLVEVAAA